MTQRRRLVLYLLLNVLISACVTISILLLYDRYFRVEPPVTVPAMVTPGAAGPSDRTMDIVSVVGAGTLENEAVQIRNNADTGVELTNWKLQTASGITYTFPGLTLLKGGMVTLHSKTGDNTVVDLYWNLSDPVWESGKLATLLDADGKVRALYRIP
jgi:hypothetical protein